MGKGDLTPHLLQHQRKRLPVGFCVFEKTGSQLTVLHVAVKADGLLLFSDRHVRADEDHGQNAQHRADDAAKAQWYPVNQLPELAFDHKEIIQIALDKLRWKIMYEPLVFHLLNETFTMTQLQTIYEAVIGKELDRRNFNKKMLQLGYVVPTEERVQGVGRPGTLYMFDEKKYREQINNRNVF